MMRVLVSQRAATGPYGDARDALERAYVDFFTAHGLLVIPVPNLPPAVPHYFDGSIGGVVLTGGNDVSPARYGGSAHPRDASAERDETEARLVQHAVERRLPVLGICRGMQFLNVFFGGSLVCDVASHPGGERHRPGAMHPVEITDSRAKAVAEATCYDTNSFHGQAVTTSTLAPGLQVFARDPDSDIVEGLYHPAHRIAGVQYHPERRPQTHPVDEHLIAAFREGRLFWEPAA